MKKLIVTVLILSFFMTSYSISASNSKDYVLSFNSDTVFELEEGVDFVISENHILVAPRYILFVLPFQVPGKGIWWDNSTKTLIFAKKDEDEYYRSRMEITVGKNYFVDLGVEYSINKSAELIDGRVYLPLRAISEAYNKEVKWEKVNGQGVIEITDIKTK